MKRGVEVWSDYDATGKWCLRMKKARGRFTLDEITEIATAWEQEFYALIIKAIDADMMQYFDYDTGDYVTLYRAEDFFKS